MANDANQFGRHGASAHRFFSSAIGLFSVCEISLNYADTAVLLAELLGGILGLFSMPRRANCNVGTL